ncbi:MAG: hypothetical protein C0483_00600 [Pirellula sp.]|nr:hypothetical protein [Pirellula sp.]
MPDGIAELSSLEDLRGFVERRICDEAQFLAGAFDFDEQLLRRHGRSCGLHFRLRGPRAVQYSAIWDAACHAILFYDCNGNRFQRIKLAECLQLQDELADIGGTSDTSDVKNACVSFH